MGLSKRLAWWFSVGLTASLLAFAIFVMLSLDIMRSSSVKNGDWHTNLLAGDAEAGIYQKAVISIVGLLASTRKDSIYYLANTADGKPFSLNCDYRLEGGSLDADWWSITAYGRDAFLIPNSDNRYSFNNANVARDEKGGFSIVVFEDYRGFLMALLPPGAFIGLGLIVALKNVIDARQKTKQAKVENVVVAEPAAG
mgnify:CR=1 FL=1